MLKLWLVRHGETIANRDHCIQGQSESPLTACGRSQAERLRERLKRFRFDAVFSSDLSRAVETARIIAPGHPLVTLESLRERAFGPWEGKSFLELKADNPALCKVLFQDALIEETLLPGMESGPQLMDRAGVALEAIRARCPEGVAIAVSHGGTLRAVFYHIHGTILRHRPTMSNTALGLVVHDGMRWHIRSWNDSSHLQEGRPSGETAVSAPEG